MFSIFKHSKLYVIDKKNTHSLPMLYLYHCYLNTMPSNKYNSKCTGKSNYLKNDLQYKAE